MQYNPNNIPGIHNYCDRWCERCHFTNRCAVYEKTSDIPPEEMDMQNKAFWDRLSANFKEMLEMLKKGAEEHGIDLNAISEEEEQEIIQKQENKRKFAEQHPLSVLSKQYIDDAHQWLEDNRALEEKEEELMQDFTLGIKDEEGTKKVVASIKDCLEVIQWYIFFIHVKFIRALSGMLEEDGWEEENGFQKDSDGSAKIASTSVEAVDRSIQAWVQLCHHLPQEEDRILTLLAQLQKIKTLGEKTFPDAWKFIRPGFDE